MCDDHLKTTILTCTTTEAFTMATRSMALSFFYGESPCNASVACEGEMNEIQLQGFVSLLSISFIGLSDESKLGQLRRKQCYPPQSYIIDVSSRTGNKYLRTTTVWCGGERKGGWEMTTQLQRFLSFCTTGHKYTGHRY